MPVRKGIRDYYVIWYLELQGYQDISYNLKAPGNGKERFDKFLPLSKPLASQAAWTDIDQVAARLCC